MEISKWNFSAIFRRQLLKNKSIVAHTTEEKIRAHYADKVSIEPSKLELRSIYQHHLFCQCKIVGSRPERHGHLDILFYVNKNSENVKLLSTDFNVVLKAFNPDYLEQILLDQKRNKQ